MIVLGDTGVACMLIAVPSGTTIPIYQIGFVQRAMIVPAKNISSPYKYSRTRLRRTPSGDNIQYVSKYVFPNMFPIN